jgi:hypothetical protein
MSDVHCGVAMPIAAHLRPMMAILFLASLFLLGFRWAAVRMRSQKRTADSGSLGMELDAPPPGLKP